MASPEFTVLLTRAIDICSSVVNLKIGHRALQDEARELIGLLAQFKPFIPQPGTRCGCGSGAVRLRDGQPFCYSCWMVLQREEGEHNALQIAEEVIKPHPLLAIKWKKYP